MTIDWGAYASYTTGWTEFDRSDALMLLDASPGLAVITAISLVNEARDIERARFKRSAKAKLFKHRGIEGEL